MAIGAPRTHPLPKKNARYGQWKVIGKARQEGSYCGIPCRCTCGTEREIIFSNLYAGLSTGCGCKRKEKLRARNTVHGETNTRLHRIWASAKQRTSPSATGLNKQQYYDKGIRMCARWRRSYIAFRDWALANDYADDLVLDRKKGTRNYEPSNCRWITRSQNARNSGNAKLVTAFGETKCLAEWAEDSRCSVPARLIGVRLKIGMDPERAISMPHRWR